MKELRQKFSYILESNPNHSSIMCFILLVGNKGFEKEVIHKAFNKLVDRDDWVGTSREQLLNWLFTRSNAN